MIFGRQQTIEDELKSFFKDNGCDYKPLTGEDDGMFHYGFEFQRGKFIATGKNEPSGIEISYPCIMSAPFAHLDIVRSMVNDFSNNHMLLKFSYKRRPKEGKLHVTISFFIFSINEDELINSLLNCFDMQHKFIAQYEDNVKNIDKDDDNPDPEMLYMLDQRQLALLREQELDYQQKKNPKIELVAKDPLKLSTFLSTMLAGDKLIPVRLAVDTPNFHEITEESMAVGDYDLRKAIITGEGEDAKFRDSYANLTVKYETFDDTEKRLATIMMVPSGDDGHTLWLRVTVCDIPRDPSSNQPFDSPLQRPQSTTVLIGIDRATGRQHDAEAHYMWTDAQLKAKDGEELTPEQKLLATINQTDYAFCFYWGTKYYMQGRLVEAYASFKAIYDSMAANYVTLDEQETRAFYETCYFLGACLTAMGQPERATFYVQDIINNGNIKHQMATVNALVASRNPIAIKYMNEIQTTLKKQFGDDEPREVIDEDDEDDGNEIPEYIRRFGAFIRRGQVRALINCGAFDGAKKILRQVAKYPGIGDEGFVENMNRLITAEKRTRRKPQPDNPDTK